MFTPRLALAALASILLSGLSSAVTFSPEFQKTIEANLAKLKQEVQEYPKLQSAVDGIPMDAAGWAALSRDDIVTTLRFFSDQKASALKNLLVTDPENAKKVEQFSNDSFKFITDFVDNIKSGAFTVAPAASTPAPTTKAPEATTAAPTVTTAVPTAISTPAPSAAEEKASAPAESAAAKGSSGSDAGSAGAEEVKPVTTTKPVASATPATTKASSAAGLVTTVAPALVGAVTAAFFTMC